MRISAVERYGLRCLMALARLKDQQHVSIPEIAERERLSVPYTSKLLSILRRAELVNAERGRGGGFRIARKPSEITLLEVLTALGGPLMEPPDCRGKDGRADRCSHEGSCSVHGVLDGLAGYLGEILDRTTVQDMLNYEDQLSAGATAALIDPDSMLTKAQGPDKVPFSPFGLEKY